MTLLGNQAIEELSHAKLKAYAKKLLKEIETLEFANKKTDELFIQIENRVRCSEILLQDQLRAVKKLRRLG